MTLDDCILRHDGEDYILDRQLFLKYLDELEHPRGRWKSLLWVLVGIPVYLVLHFGPLALVAGS